MKTSFVLSGFVVLDHIGLIWIVAIKRIKESGVCNVYFVSTSDGTIFSDKKV